MQAYYSDINTTGVVKSDGQGLLIGSVASMPAAGSAPGVTVLYTGPDAGGYKKGRFYTSDGTAWVASTIGGLAGLVANRALVTDASGTAVSSDITASELNNLDGITENIQSAITQIRSDVGAITNSNTSITASLENKVDKVTGKQLSTNDYTDADQAKLAGIGEGAEVNVIERVSVNGADLPISDKGVDIAIPTGTAGLTNDANFITKAVSDLENYFTKAEVNDLHAAITQFRIEVKTPAEFQGMTGQANTLYFVGPDGSGTDIYTEYVWLTQKGAFERIGSTAFTLNIIQNSAGITINNTVLQDASATQDGLMTKESFSKVEIAVPNTRTINGKPLSGDVTLGVGDISGAIGASALEPYVPKAGTTMTGKLVASPTAPSEKQVRNVTFSTAEPTAQDGEDGDIWYTYSDSEEYSPVAVEIVQSTDAVTIAGTSIQTASTERAGLMTSAHVNTISTLDNELGSVQDAVTGLQNGKADKTAINTLQLAMEDKADKSTVNTLTDTVATKADKSTVYTKSQVDSKYNAVVIVSALPSAPEADKTAAIYSIPDPEGEEDNLRKEYYWDGTKWELIGGGGSGGVSFFIHGRVTASAGNPDLSGITVTATASGDQPRTTTTNSNGEYSVEVKQGLIYTVAGSKANFVFTNPSQSITISDLNNDAPDISCYELAKIQVTVTGVDVSGRTISLSGASNATKTTDSSGKALFEGLAIGSYTVACDYPAGQGIDSASKSVTTTAGTTSSVSFNVLAKPTVQVTVSSQHGSKNGLTVVATPNSGSAVEVDTNSSGVATFTLDAGKTYSFDVKSVPTNFVDVTAVTSKSFAAGTTYSASSNKVSLIMKRKPTLTVTNNDEESKTISVTVNGSTQSIAKGSSYTWYLPSESTYAISATTPSGASGVTINPSSISAVLDGEHTATVAGTYTIVYAVDVKISESDPVARCTYPSSVTLGDGKTYPVANASYTKSSGTALSTQWASAYNSGTSVISGIVPGELTTAGVFTEAATKTAIPSGSTGNNAVTHIPTWYFSMENDGTHIKYRWANQKITGMEDRAGSYAGSRKGHFRVACWGATATNTDDNTSGSLQSIKGSGPTRSISITNFIAKAKNTGAGYDIMTWDQWTYLGALCILLWGSTDLQGSFAAGYSSGSAVQNNSAFSLTTTQYGMSGTASSTGGTARMSFFWIADLWGNMWQFVGGAKTNGSYKLMTIKNFNVSSVSDSDFDTTTYGPSSSISGSISKVVGNTQAGHFPIECSASDTSYFADRGIVYASYFPVVGGRYNYYGYCGPFFANFNLTATYTDSFIGSRLSYRL